MTDEQQLDKEFFEALESLEPIKVEETEEITEPKKRGRRKGDYNRKTPSNYKRAIIHNKGEAVAAVIKTAKEALKETDDKTIQKEMKVGKDWLESITGHEREELATMIVKCNYRMDHIHDAVWRRWNVIFHDKPLSDEIIKVKVEEETKRQYHNASKKAIQMEKNRRLKDKKTGMTPFNHLSTQLGVVEDTILNILLNVQQRAIRAVKMHEDFGGITNNELNAIKGAKISADVLERAYKMRMKGDPDGPRDIDVTPKKGIGDQLMETGR